MGSGQAWPSPPSHDSNVSTPAARSTSTYGAMPGSRDPSHAWRDAAVLVIWPPFAAEIAIQHVQRAVRSKLTHYRLPPYGRKKSLGNLRHWMSRRGLIVLSFTAAAALAAVVAVAIAGVHRSAP